MKKSLLTVAAFCVVLAVGCKKQLDLPHVPSIQSVVLAGDVYAEDEQGTLTFVRTAVQGEAALAYLNTDPKELRSVAEIRRDATAVGNAQMASGVAAADGEAANFIHLFSPDDDADYWVREENVVLNASPVVLLEDKPFCATLTNNPAQFAETATVIPAHTIVAVHHVGTMLDYLQVSWYANGAVQTGFIENPHPFFSTAYDDAEAIRLYNASRALGDDEKEAKKSLLDSALSLENLTPSVRELIQAARKALDPPPAPAKANGAYMRLRAPDLSSVRSGSRYGVNMGELLKGGTEDPWAKKTN